ncbi:MAG: fimbria/pilus outer membrane usher protein [Burkholderiaceae bacterium]
MSRSRTSRRKEGRRGRMASAARFALLLPVAAPAFAADCSLIGLSETTRAIVQLREAGQPNRMALSFRDAAGAHWFLPLALAAGQPAGRETCTSEGGAYVKVPAKDPALTVDADQDIVSFVNLQGADDVIDARVATMRATAQPLTSVGLNYQLTASHAANETRLSAFTDTYAWYRGWYASNTLGFSRGRTQRFDTFALRESLETGVFTRVGDATTAPSPMGESLRFAGVAWGTDRGLQYANYLPVLPDIRSGSVVAGPVEVFLNDTLRFQQNVQSGVYDVRNIPAQQGFNSYSVRTLDAQGNPVTVTREIYLPASLLPPGSQAWRVDAGWQRKDTFGDNPRYGDGLVSGSYSRGLTHDMTVGGYAIHNKDVSMVALDADRRLADLWTGHLGTVLARSAAGGTHAIRARLEGGGRNWRLFGEWLGSPDGLPSLSPTRNPVLAQRIIRAQYTGFSRASLSFTYAESERVGEQPESVASLQAFLRPFDSGLMMSASVYRSRSATGFRQTGFSLTATLPLDRAKNVGQSVSASVNGIDDVRIARLQYDRATPGDGSPESMSNLSLGATNDSRLGQSADAFWAGNTSKAEIFASARAAEKGMSDAQLTVRSGVVHTQGSTFFTRPVTGSFALVSTGQENVTVFHENRPMGKTNAQGLVLVTSLRPMEINRMTVDPTEWPMDWNASVVERQVVPPRGGGVLVSFKVSANAWPAETMVFVPDEEGKPYPAGTVAFADVDGEERSTVVNGQGQVWLGEFLPATACTVRRAGKRCEYRVPPAGEAIAARARLERCTEGV